MVADYKNSAGYATGSDTSRQAAQSLFQRGSLQFEVLKALYENHAGMVVDDALIHMRNVMKRDFDRSTIGARFTELKDAGLIEATSGRGITARGKSAVVYKITIKGRDYILNN